MKLTSIYFVTLLKDWFSGAKTVPEIIFETKEILNIEKFIEQGYVFDYAFSLALCDFSGEYENVIDFYLAEEKVLCLTTEGLQRNLEKLRDKLITKKQFIEWSSWSNIGCENSTLDIENSNIEYFCTIFILDYTYLLSSDSTINSIIKMIRASNSVPYGKFIIYLYLLIDTERKSMYYFFKDFISGKKSDEQLNLYLTKKFNYNLPEFKYDLEIFPYLDELIILKEHKGSIEELFSKIEFKSA